MKKDIEKIINAINDGLVEVQQDNLFGSDSTCLENACIDYLRYKGYGVKEPITPFYNIKKLNDLISLFYDFLSKYNEKDVIIYKNEKQDLKIAKTLVEVVQNMDGLSKQVAMNQCAIIIRIVFKNIGRFKFNIPLTFGIFGQQRMSWVTELAIKIMNEEIIKYKEVIVEKRIDEIIARCPKEEIGWSDDMINLALKQQKEK